MYVCMCGVDMISLPLQVFSTNGRGSNESEGCKVWPGQHHVPHLNWDTAGLWQVPQLSFLKYNKEDLPLIFYSNRYNKLGLNQRTTFRMQVKSLWNKASVCVLVYIHI